MKFQMTISDVSGGVKIEGTPNIKSVLDSIGKKTSFTPAEHAFMLALDAMTGFTDKKANKALHTRSGLILPGDRGPLGRF